MIFIFWSIFEVAFLVNRSDIWLNLIRRLSSVKIIIPKEKKLGNSVVGFVEKVLAEKGRQKLREQQKLAAFTAI
jgi:hypothetical protein